MALPWRRTVCDILKPVLTDVKKTSAKLKIGGETTLLGFPSANTTSGFAAFVLTFYVPRFCPVLLDQMTTKWRRPTGVRELSGAKSTRAGKKRREIIGLEKNGTKALGPKFTA